MSALLFLKEPSWYFEIGGIFNRYGILMSYLGEGGGFFPRKGSYGFSKFYILLHYLGYLVPLHTWDWGPVTIALLALSFVENTELVQVCFRLCLRDQWSKWMQDGCKVYMDFYVASNGSCSMVTWIILKNHLLEVGLTQNLDIMALRNLTIVALL